MDSTSIQFRSHTALLLAAALPYLQPSYCHMAELAMKFLELSETLKLIRDNSIPHPFSRDSLQKASTSGESGIFAILSRFIKDPEGLLSALLTVCTGKEKDMVHMLLNLLQAKNFYDNYGDILQTFMSADNFTNPFASQPASAPDTSSPEEFSMPDMASVLAGGDLSSLLNQEQTDTLNLLKNLLDAE